MFDSIYFKCTECGKDIEAQSKSGACSLDKYDHTNVPRDVAEDCNRHAPFTCDCGARFQFEESGEKFVNLRVIKL